MSGLGFGAALVLDVEVRVGEYEGDVRIAEYRWAAYWGGGASGEGSVLLDVPLLAIA